MTDKSKHRIFASLLKILACYKKEEIEEAFKVFFNKKAISKDDFGTLNTRVAAGGSSDELIGLVVNHLSTNKDWKGSLLRSFRDRGFPGDRRLKKLLCSAVESTNNDVAYLIDAWSELDKVKKRVLHYIKSTWSAKFWKKYSKHQRVRKYSWKVYVLSKCATTKKPEKTKLLAENVKEWLQQVTEEHETEEGREVTEQYLDDPEEGDEPFKFQDLLIFENLEVLTLEFRLKTHGALCGEPRICFCKESYSIGAKSYTFNSEKDCFIALINVSQQVDTICYKVNWDAAGSCQTMFYGNHQAERSYTITKVQKNIGHVLLYDIVSDEPKGDAQMEEMLLTNMCQFLPPLHSKGTLWNRVMESHEQLTIEEELYYWVCQIIKGWKIIGNEHLRFQNLQDVFAKTLAFWLADSPDQCGYRSQECIISLVIFLGLIRRKCTVMDRQTMAMICNSLSIHTYTRSDQIILQEKLIEKYDSLEGLPAISSVFHALFKRISFNLAAEWILLLPLYWLIERDTLHEPFPNTITMSDHLPELPKIVDCAWDEVKWKLSNDDAQEYYRGVLGLIQKIWEVNPWIVRPYVFMLRSKILLSMVETNEGQIDFIPPEIIIVKLIGAIGLEESEVSLEDVRRVSGYVEKYMQKLANDIKGSEKHDENYVTALAQVLESFDTCLRSTMEKKWTNILWILDCGYAPTQAALEMGYGHVSFKGMWQLLLYACSTSLTSSKTDGVRMNFSDWNQLISYKWVKEDLSHTWLTKVMASFKDKIEQNCDGHEPEFLDEYANIPHDIDENLQEVLDEKCLACVNHVLMKPQTSLIMKSDKHKRLAKMFEKIFASELQKRGHCSNDDEKVLEFILQWRSTVVFYQNFYQKKFAQDAPTVANVTAVFNRVMECLISGSITIKILGIVMTHSEVLASLYAVVNKEEGSSTDAQIDMPNLLGCRKHEYDTIGRLLRTFPDFRVMCDSIREVGIPVSFSEVEKIFADKNSVSLSSMMELVQTDENVPKAVTTVDLDNLETMLRLKDNRIFQYLWKKTAQKWHNKQKKKKKGVICNWRIALRKILVTAQHELEAYKKLILDGKAYLRNLNIWLEGCEEPRKVVEELFDPDEIRMITTSLNRYLKLKQCSGGLVFVLQAKRLFSMQGDCSLFESLKYNMVSKTNEHAASKDAHVRSKWRKRKKRRKKKGKRLSSKSNHCLLSLQDIQYDELGEDLRWLDEIAAVANELEAFFRHEKFIAWLQQKIHGPDEINSMCDLALTYDTDKITELVNAFSNAVQGFSPLIFDIVGEYVRCLGMRCWHLKWNAAKRNFLEDWDKAASKHQLFEEIELRHGSVEKSFLQMIRTINRCGTFHVRCTAERTQSLQTMVWVSYSDAGGNEQHEVKVNFKDLHEGYSVLMLMTKVEESTRKRINHFSSLFTTVVKLGESLIALADMGCMLFLNFSVEIRPDNITDGHDEDQERQSQLIITVLFDEGGAPLSSATETYQISELVRVLEKAKTEWSQHIMEKRMKHYYLNEYSIRQITYLCRELAMFRYNGRLPDQVYALLSVISVEPWPNIMDWLENATSRLHQESSDGGIESGEDTPLNKDQMVRKLLSEGVDEDMAKAAVQSALDEDPYGWLLLHQHDEELVTELAENFDTDMEFSTSGPSQQISTSYAQSIMECDLAELVESLTDESKTTETPIHLIVENISNNFMTKTTSLTLRNHLNIEHLGRFLEQIREYAKEEVLLDRALMQPLQMGRPNLVICNDDDVLMTVISLYMHNSGPNPLPTKSEVLVCSEDTTVHEIERFMLRAMTKDKNKGKPLFCLPFCDKLNFSVMKQVEETYNSMKGQGMLDENYQLVFICGNQRSYIASCFEKDQVSLMVDTSHQALSNYIMKFLTVKEEMKESAALIDENRQIKLVASAKSGNGKSLYIKRIQQNLKSLQQMPRLTTIRLLEKRLNVDMVLSKLLADDEALSYQNPNFVWLDFTPAVKHGIEKFIFDLIILGHIESTDGKVWRRHENHYYVVEITDKGLDVRKQFAMKIFNILPHVIAISPGQTQDKEFQRDPYIQMDEQEFLSPDIQRPYQYLRRLSQGSLPVTFSYDHPEGDPVNCVKVLLDASGSSSMSWSQLKCFASFLNIQLKNCELSDFLNLRLTGPEFYHLKEFVVRFMIRMAQDFGTATPEDEDATSNTSEDIALEISTGMLAGRRRWEDSLHPYIFFNEDHETVTFINVNMNRDGDLVDFDGKVLKKQIADWLLVAVLVENGVKLGKKFDTFTRDEKLEELCRVVGVGMVFDPDETYELTADCVQKLIAIHMRFRCQIPVIIMGETGCGKTRMVEFLSKLLAKKAQESIDSQEQVKNLIVRKIYGGITTTDIFRTVWEAEEIAKKNHEEHGICTILFFDEANTTEAIHAIKEVICDHTVDGKPIKDVPLHIIAACNPYRKLSENAIKRLENSGLGSKIHASTAEQMEGNEMRSLLYRVNPLPPSLNPFVWNFGQLDFQTEMLYIEKIANKHITEMDHEKFCFVVARAQKFMREQEDECRFVSLRDVERCVMVFQWFMKHHKSISCMLKGQKLPSLKTDEWAILQTLGVCYHASLEDRLGFRKDICRSFREGNIHQTLTEVDVLEEFKSVESIFLKGIKLGDGICCNEALLENFFMMAICIDLKIPLFLIGKPGSSKSLAKKLISNNMQGRYSRTDLFQNMKQVRLVPYQCSALSAADEIKGIFAKCVRLQEDANEDSYTAVAVLDEIGLAEDSPKMPLKILHPLLESGTLKTETITSSDRRCRVGFIGISNWPLDPAKLNRGIFVLRAEPNKEDLLHIGQAICQGAGDIPGNDVQRAPLVALTDAYLEIYRNQRVEYFGLRDYYNLIKMVCKGSWGLTDIFTAVVRNFGGGKNLEECNVLQTFQSKLRVHYPAFCEQSIPLKTIVGKNLEETDSRFLLLLTGHHPSTSLVSILVDDCETKCEVVFGSSFPGDHNYTEICRNLNLIKVRMERGDVVILLNMTEIHESLYDALNQHSVMLGGKRYVDLGFGEHRVKCCISPQFRLIIIEQKLIAHNEYPIPLLNRLEKHHLTASSLLQEHDHKIIATLNTWVESLNTEGFSHHEAFVGYHDDTVPSVVMFQNGEIATCKHVLMQSMTMDAVIRYLAEKGSQGPDEGGNGMYDAYFEKQCHGSVIDLLSRTIAEEKLKPVTSFEIVTYCHVLSMKDKLEYQKRLGLSENSMMIMNLEQFYTRKECEDKLDSFLKRCTSESGDGASPCVALLLVQCMQGQRHGALIECFKHIWSNKMRAVDVSSLQRSVIAIILWSVERAENSELHCSYHQTGNLILQQSKTYDIIYVDELAHDDCGMPVAKLLRGRISDLFSPKGEDDKRHIMHIIQDCICDAVRKVKTPWSGWYIQCLKAMTHLCSSQEDLSRKFQDILLEKLRDGHATLERSTASASSHFCSDHWIAKESYNREKLQEGGTFRKTLMLRIKDLTSQLLAHLISLMAVNQNLDIISEVGEEDWKCEMWLTMFKDLGVKWEKNTLGKFHVATKRGLDQLCANKFPFSSAITDLFEDLWKKMEHDDSKMWKLIESFRKSQFFSSIKTEIGRENLAEIMTAYNHDLITALYTPANVGEEFEAVKKIVLDLSEYEWQKMAANSSDGDQIPLIFYMFQKLSKTLEILSSLFLAQPQLFSKVDDWIEKQKASETDIIHHCALSDAIEVLHCDARKKDHETCLEWLRSFSQINLIFHPLLDLFGESEKKAILKKWMPLSLLELMLLQLLPVETELKLQYSEIIWVQSILLLKGSESLDLQSEDFLAVVCNVLKKCYEDIRLKFGLSWQSTKCKVCKRQMREPMLLDCGHFLCQKCFKAFQSREPPICPFCRNEVSKSPVSWGLSSDEMEQVAKFKSRCTEVFVEFLRNIGFSTHFPGSSKVKFRRLSKILLCVIGGTKTDMKQTLRTEAINLDLSTAANILSLVMDNDPENARQQINTMLETLDQSNTVQLAGVILGYFERKMYYDRYGEDVQQQEGILGYDNLLNDAWNTIEALKGSKPNLRMLQSIAHVRYCLRKIIGYLCSNRGESTTNPSLQMFCSSVSTIFGNDGIKSNVLRKFLFKAGCDFVGIKWYYMLQSQGLQDLLPYELHNRKLDICGDYLSLMGEKYITTKCSLLSCQHDVADLVRSICSGLTGDGSHQKIMALIEWARIISTDSLEISDVLCHPQILPLAKLYERISSLGVVTASLHSSKNVLPSLAILMNMILSEKCTLMEVFRKLVDHPNDISSFNPSSMFKKDTGHVCTDWAASVIQGMLNICLLIGLSKNRDAVARLLQYEKQHIESILVEGIETSLEKQMSLLQRSKDEIIMTMHLVLIEMLRIKKIDELAEEHFDWITVEGMTSWQKLFCKHYLEPMYDDLDMKLSSAKERLEEDMVATKNPLFMLLKDIPSDVSPIENLSWKHSALWMYTKELTLDDFCRSLENHEERTGHAGVVNVILNTRNLDFGKYLESILKFQQIMTARCQNHKFEKLCEAIESEQENEKAEEYLRIWNKVCVEADFKVMAKDTGIPISYLHEASINSPVSICLPSICGQGRCAKLLVSYLIDIQNSFLDNCAEIGKYPMRTTKMDVSRLSHSQFVSIDVKRDLLPLIFTYTKYDIVTSRAGRQHNITYNFETLEKQVEGRFVSYKQRIDKKTIPCFRAPYDMQTESEWKEVQSKAPQKQLPMSMVRQIAATAWHSTKIYSAVRAIAQAITFIAKGDVEPKTSLVKFLVTELALPAAEVQAIPSAANIEHILPLYSHLSWHRTIVYMSRGLNPYRDAVCYTPLENVKDKKLIEEIQHGFEHVEIPTLQRHLNELIIRVPDFPPDSSLVDDVLPHYEFESEGGKEDWVSRIPREVCLKHSSHLISLSLEFQQSMETS